MESLFSGKSTLILDKQLEDLQSLRAILGNLGFGEVLVASSVNMALSLLRERPVDICFLNYELGRNEKNGLQLLLEMQAESNRRYAASYVLVVEPERSDLLFGSPENAPDIYISKPYDVGRMRLQLEKLLRIKQTLLPVEQLLDQGEWEQALIRCELQEQNYPGLRVYLQRLRGIIQLRLRRPIAALSLFQGLLAERDQTWIRVAVAIAACQSGRFALAREQLDQVITRQQVCVEAFAWRARLHRLYGEDADALGLLRRAVVLQPTVALLQGDLANQAAMNGDMSLALDAFRSALRFARYSAFQHPDYYFGLVRLLMGRLDKRGDPASQAALEEAIRVLESAQRDFLEDPVINFKVRLVSGEVYQAVGDTARAERLAQEALQLFLALPVDEQAMWIDQLLEGAEHASVVEEVRRQRQELTRKMAGLQWGRANLRGMMQFRNGELRPAYDSFSTALELAPDNSSIALNLVQTALEMIRRGDNALEELHSACGEVLYSLQYAGLSPRQQQRYVSLSQRLAESVRSQDVAQAQA